MSKVGAYAILIIMSIFVLLGCSESKQPLRPEPRVYKISDSFEDGFSAWTINSLDVEVDKVEIDWYVVSSDERASNGLSSAKLYMDNLTDAAKIWLERSIKVAPNKTHQVTISFDLASSDYGDVNLFSILANVLPYNPTTRDDVTAGVSDGDFPEGTHNGGVQDFVWLDKSLTKSVTSRDDGMLYFILGIWGTWEGARTYYFDDLRVTVREE
jgi:hypothetical protein